MTRILLSLFLAVVVMLAARIGISDEKGTPDSQIGLSKVSVFEVANPDPVNENTSDPGEEPTLPRAFSDAPPRISHGITEFLPITLRENQCMDCHKVEKKEEGEPTPIPQSHFVDLRNAPDYVREDVAGARYLCITCHVPQTGAAPLVENEFQK
jgi:cytochrome c-type protein NapB